MEQQSLPDSFMNFAKSIFILGERYHLKNTARQELDEHIHNVKAKAHQKKKISADEIEKIKEHVHHVIDKEKKFFSFNAVEQEKLEKLEEDAAFLGKKLSEERRKNEKLDSEVESLANENENLIRMKNEEIRELRQTLGTLKNALQSIMRNRNVENVKRKKELDALDRKINREIGSSY